MIALALVSVVMLVTMAMTGFVLMLVMSVYVLIMLLYRHDLFSHHILSSFVVTAVPKAAPTAPPTMAPSRPPTLCPTTAPNPPLTTAPTVAFPADALMQNEAIMKKLANELIS